ncbi:MAG: hypothetical protein K0S47_4695 [Herbinix sp.]|jgi:hypothetical protein|nr:hypothetical protein [Herbinix sp.]
MDKKQLLIKYWNDIACQDADAIKDYFCNDAAIRWHCTNEFFNVDEFLIANCEYPGNWCSEVERIEEIGELVISVTRVWLTDESMSFHVTSFFRFQANKIAELDEYWGDDGNAPQWRLDKHIGSSIK